MLEKVIKNYAVWGLLILRLTLGIVFVLHGSQKITTFFGGSGLEGTAEAFANMGIFLPTISAYFVAFGEFFGGILLIMGLLTREVSIVITLIMAGAIYYVHGSNGFFITQDGYEYNVMIISVCICLILSGGGAFSIDRVLFPEDKWTFVKDPSKIKLEPPVNK